MDLDLIVVGAGPAGYALAREMALERARILRAYRSGRHKAVLLSPPACRTGRQARRRILAFGDSRKASAS